MFILSDQLAIHFSLLSHILYTDRSIGIIFLHLYLSTDHLAARFLHLSIFSTIMSPNRSIGRQRHPFLSILSYIFLPKITWRQAYSTSFYHRQNCHPTYLWELKCQPATSISLHSLILSIQNSIGNQLPPSLFSLILSSRDQLVTSFLQVSQFSVILSTHRSIGNQLPLPLNSLFDIVPQQII